MKKNKRYVRICAALLCAVLCMTAFATVAYADGGDYYDDELPPETWQEEPQPEEMPQTPIWLLVALLAVSAGVLTTVSIRGRKRITRNFSESVD